MKYARLSVFHVPLALGLSMMLMSSAAVRAAADDAEDAMKAKLLDAFEKLESDLSHVAGTVTYRKYRLPIRRFPDGHFEVVEGGEPTYIAHRENQFKVNGRLKRVVLRSKPATGLPTPFRELVFCIGPDYSFFLERRLGQGGYIVKAFGKDYKVGATIDGDYMLGLGAPYRFGRTKFKDILNDKSFSIKKLENTKHQGIDCVKIYYSFSPTGKIVFRDGWIIVAPSRGWAIQAFAMEALFSGKHIDDYLRGTVEYRTSDTGRVLPSRVRRMVFGGALCEEYDFDKIEYVNVPESEFTLPAFGLPDLGSPPKGGWQLGASAWFYLAAVIFLALAVLLAWRVRRARATDHPMAQA